MNWYKIASSSEIVGFLSGGHLAEQYNREYLQAGSPKGAPIFEVTEGNNVYYAISPKAAVVAQALLFAYDSVQCDPPLRENSKVLIGFTEDMDLLKA